MAAAWLAGLPGIQWRLRRPHRPRVPYMIERVACVEGVLLLAFAQEETGRSPGGASTAWDRVRVMTNRALYPGRWRPLSRAHRLELLGTRPELRPHLQAAGQELG